MELELKELVELVQNVELEVLTVDLEDVLTAAGDDVVTSEELEELVTEVEVCKTELLLVDILLMEPEEPVFCDAYDVVEMEVCEEVEGPVVIADEGGTGADAERVLCEDWEVEVEELTELVELEAGTVTVTGGELTLIIEYPVAVTVVALGDGVMVTRTVCVSSGPSIVVVETT